jgi:hypothetical protein
MVYADAARALHQVPLAQFVAERKRLADELRTAGDRKGASKLRQLARPSVSAWVTNQLYWHARDLFDAMLATAARLRDGDLGAGGEHREAIAKLRERATAMLTDAGHAATSATLHKVVTNLAAIAALGGFFPDEPGEMNADRDPPGFDTKPP